VVGKLAHRHRGGRCPCPRDVRYATAGLAKILPVDSYALLREAVMTLSPKAQTLLAATAVCAPEGFRLALAAEAIGLAEDCRPVPERNARKKLRPTPGDGDRSQR
jgi:hypothetical protein